jgi:hypothetical protein
MVMIFPDIDSAYRAAQAMAADGAGIAVGVQSLVKRVHEGGWLKSVDGNLLGAEPYSPQKTKHAQSGILQLSGYS